MLRTRRLRRVIGLATLGCFFTACYAQQPLTANPPPVATRIIAMVTDTGSVMMANAIGPGAVEIEGIVVEADQSAWKLQMVRVDQRGGMSTRWNRELVSFPRLALTNVAMKTLDKKRSWVVASILTALALTATMLWSGVVGGENVENPPPPPL